MAYSTPGTGALSKVSDRFKAQPLDNLQRSPRPLRDTNIEDAQPIPGRKATPVCDWLVCLGVVPYASKIELSGGDAPRVAGAGNLWKKIVNSLVDPYLIAQLSGNQSEHSPYGGYRRHQTLLPFASSYPDTV